MILEILFSIFACFFILDGIVLLILILHSMIKDIIDNLKRWYKGDGWGWTEILEGYGYQKRYG